MKLSDNLGKVLTCKYVPSQSNPIALHDFRSKKGATTSMS